MRGTEEAYEAAEEGCDEQRRTVRSAAARLRDPERRAAPPGGAPRTRRRVWALRWHVCRPAAVGTTWRGPGGRLTGVRRAHATAELLRRSVGGSSPRWQGGDERVDQWDQFVGALVTTCSTRSATYAVRSGRRRCDSAMPSMTTLPMASVRSCAVWATAARSSRRGGGCRSFGCQQANHAKSPVLELRKEVLMVQKSSLPSSWASTACSCAEPPVSGAGAHASPQRSVPDWAALTSTLRFEPCSCHVRLEGWCTGMLTGPSTATLGRLKFSSSRSARASRSQRSSLALGEARLSSRWWTACSPNSEKLEIFWLALGLKLKQFNLSLILSLS